MLPKPKRKNTGHCEQPQVMKNAKKVAAVKQPHPTESPINDVISQRSEEIS